MLVVSRCLHVADVLSFQKCLVGNEKYEYRSALDMHTRKKDQ